MITFECPTCFKVNHIDSLETSSTGKWIVVCECGERETITHDSFIRRYGDNVYELLKHYDGVSNAFIHMQNEGAKYLCVVREDMAKTYKTHYESSQLIDLVDMRNFKESDETLIKYALEHLSYVSGCYVMVNGEKEVAFEMVIKQAPAFKTLDVDSAPVIKVEPIDE